MQDLISRQEAIDSIGKCTDIYVNNLPTMVDKAEAYQALNEVPSAQHEPGRKKGKWSIKNGELAFWDVCSECRKMVMHKAPFYNFCPNCGADMRE